MMNEAVDTYKEDCFFSLIICCLESDAVLFYKVSYRKGNTAFHGIVTLHGWQETLQDTRTVY